MAIYALIVLSTVAALAFRNNYWVRVLSVAALIGVAMLHFTYLLAQHRLLLESGSRHFDLGAGDDLPPAFDFAVWEVQRISHSELGLFTLLIAAFTILGLFPAILKQRKDNCPPIEVG